MKVTLGKPYQFARSGRWYVYVECPDGKLRRFTCREASPVYEINLNPNVRRFPRRRIKGRFDVLARDNYTCQYCGRKAPDVVLQVDHVVPVAKGGTDDPANLVTACYDCNEGKGPRHSGAVADPPPADVRWEGMLAAAVLMDKMLTDG